MRVGFRDGGFGVSKIGEYDGACVWTLGRVYDDARVIFSGDDSYDKILDKLKAIDDEELCYECIAVYKNDSKLKPVFFGVVNKNEVVADFYGDTTTSIPDVVYLWSYKDGKCRKLFDSALAIGYLDFKDFDGAMMIYSDIPETAGDHVKGVLLDLEKNGSGV